jgi:hypothetical protein
MLDVMTDGASVWFGERFSLTFQRTLRIPDDGNTYPLPPGFGSFPIHHVADYKKKVPAEWVKRGGVFIPMYQREALWISFSGDYSKPRAVKIGVGKINAVSGKAWEQTIQKRKQDYLVCPPQPWLDGIKAGKGHIRQFVAMPLGEGYTVEGQLTGKEEWGGIQVIVFEPKPGKFDDISEARMSAMCDLSVDLAMPMATRLLSMGIAAGGRMKQEIYPDPHGFDTWDSENYGRLFVNIVNSEMYHKITGLAPPPSPINAKVYTDAGFPWFDYYADGLGDLPASGKLAKVKSVKTMDQKLGKKGIQDDSPVEIPSHSILSLWQRRVLSAQRRPIKQEE